MISICIPLFKSSFLHNTLESLCFQKFTSFEVIIVNDGDNIDYSNILKNFTNLNIKYIIQKNKGAGAARNTAFKASKGEYIKFLDADDLLNENHLMKQIQLAIANPSSIISSKWGRFFHQDINTFKLVEEEIYKNCVGKDWIVESWLKGPNMTQPGIFLIPRKLIEKHGLWKEELSQGPCDDMEFFTRMILNSNGIVFAQEATLYYRSGYDDSLSGLKSKESFNWYLETLNRSSSILIQKFPEDSIVKKAIAIQYLVLGYKAYPYEKKISSIALKQASDFDPYSDYKFPAGGITHLLNKVMGWKNVIKLKQLIGYKKIN